MLKMLKTITSIIKESLEILDKVKNRSDQRKKRHLAQTLNLIYCRSNECIVTGEQIIDSLQGFVLHMGQISYSPKPRINVYGIFLEDLVRKKIENVKSLEDCLDDYSQIIKVLDTDLYLRVRQFVAYKGVGLFWIAILLERGKNAI